MNGTCAWSTGPVHVFVFSGSNTILNDKGESNSQRVAYFDAMVTPVACYAGGHRKIYKQRCCCFCAP